MTAKLFWIDPDATANDGRIAPERRIPGEGKERVDILFGDR